MAGDLSTLYQYGGFAVLAGAAIWALFESHKISLRHLDQSHSRETEALKLALQHVTASQTQIADLSKESTAALSSLCDELAGLREDLRKGLSGR